MRVMEDNWVADFETTTSAEDCRVWLWAAVNINNPIERKFGVDIESFFDWAFSRGKTKIWFHNLKFDGQFIISYLLRSHFTWVQHLARQQETFTTMISNEGIFFAIDVIGKKNCSIKFYDSLKLIRMPVEKIPRAFGLTLRKSGIEYTADRPVGYSPTPAELNYVETDCLIVAQALKKMFSTGTQGITISQAAFNNFKGRRSNFSSYFPRLASEVEEDVRQGYKGGFTYLNPLFSDIEVQGGFFVDRNSMYPAILKESMLPFGRPIFFTGQGKTTSLFPLYIQKISVALRLKDSKVPFVRSKSSPTFHPLDYVEDSKGDLVTLTLTNWEMELLAENYEIDEIHYHGGWKFKATNHAFDDYISEWYDKKSAARETGDWANYQIAKLYLNSLIGKFGTRQSGRQLQPVLDDRGIVIYKTTTRIERKSVYSPLALFCTSAARVELVHKIQQVREFGFRKYNRDIFVYSDTDSICVNMPVEDAELLSEVLDLDNYRLGAWKIEKAFSRAKFLHSKCYMTIDLLGKSHATVAGMSEKAARHLDFEKFTHSGDIFLKDAPADDLEQKRIKVVSGGAILEKNSFNIH